VTLWLTAVLVPMAGAVLTGTTARFVGRRGWSDKVTQTPVVGAVTSAVIFFYFGTLAFLLVTSTAAVSGARQNTYSEAGALREAYIATRSLPEPDRTRLREGIVGYTRLVVDQEWELQLGGGFSEAGWDALGVLQEQSGDLFALPEAQQPLVAQAIKDVHHSVQMVYAERRVREGDVTKGTPALLIAGVSALALASVSMPLLMGWPTGRRYTVGIGVLGGAVVLGLWLFTQLNLPYSNGVHVEPTAFEQALRRFPKL
jgi:hypothetical protein